VPCWVLRGERHLRIRCRRPGPAPPARAPPAARARAGPVAPAQRRRGARRRAWRKGQASGLLPAGPGRCEVRQGRARRAGNDLRTAARSPARRDPDLRRLLCGDLRRASSGFADRAARRRVWIELSVCSPNSSSSRARSTARVAGRRPPTPAGARAAASARRRRRKVRCFQRRPRGIDARPRLPDSTRTGRLIGKAEAEREPEQPEQSKLRPRCRSRGIGQSRAAASSPRAAATARPQQQIEAALAEQSQRVRR